MRRKCLRCDRVFNSKGIANRLCNDCNEHNRQFIDSRCRCVLQQQEQDEIEKDTFDEN